MLVSVLGIKEISILAPLLSDLVVLLVLTEPLPMKTRFVFFSVLARTLIVVAVEVLGSAIVVAPPVPPVEPAVPPVLPPAVVDCVAVRFSALRV